MEEQEKTPFTQIDFLKDYCARLEINLNKLNERFNGMGKVVKVVMESNARMEQAIAEANNKPVLRQLFPNASPTTGKIAAALSNAQQEIGGIAGSGSANRGSFTTLEDMEEACAPILKKYELSVGCMLITNELGEFVLVMRLGHSSDEWYESRALIREDEAGSSLPYHQKIGYAEKYMKRYMYRTMLCLADNSKD
jgi:hypothetical protein